MIIILKSMFISLLFCLINVVYAGQLLTSSADSFSDASRISCSEGDDAQSFYCCQEVDYMDYFGSYEIGIKNSKWVRSNGSTICNSKAGDSNHFGNHTEWHWRSGCNNNTWTTVDNQLIAGVCRNKSIEVYHGVPIND
jgi:hypothetical protein